MLAYPDTDVGCEGGNCTWNSGLPAPMYANPDPTIYWSYDTQDTPADSMYDVLIDNEFSAACAGTNPVPNANIAIYLDAVPSYTKLGLANSNPVLIDGQLWYTLHVRDTVSGGYDYKTEFAAVTPMPYGISGLDLGASTAGSRTTTRAGTTAAITCRPRIACRTSAPGSSCGRTATTWPVTAPGSPA